MKLFTAAIALASASTAFVLPDEQVNHLQHVEKVLRQEVNDIDSAFQQGTEQIKQDVEDVKHALKEDWDWLSAKTSKVWDEAIDKFDDVVSTASSHVGDAYTTASGWAQSVADDIAEQKDLSTLGHGPHHPHHKPNLTVYQLIAKSNYTTKLAKLINEYDDLVKALNSTKANFTVFAPTDRAFEKIPEHAPKPSKEFLKALLSYHVSPDFYPAGRVLVSRTIPTLLKSEALGKEPQPQRLTTNIGFRGLTVNFLSRVVAVDIFGTNGVIHGVDSILIPPPSVAKIIDLVPSEFSTLQLGLVKTGLFDELNSTKKDNFGTAFAPTNWAFKKLGPRTNAFLFSSYGLKYLKGLLEYHLAPKAVLYSDAFYKSEGNAEGIPKGYYHVDLPTTLKDKSLSIDISRYGRLIDIQINGWVHVSTSDIVAYNGVIHTVSSVLIPPKQLADGSLEAYEGGEISEEELKARLEPYVEHSAWTDL